MKSNFDTDFVDGSQTLFEAVHSIDITSVYLADTENYLITFSILGEVIGRDLIRDEIFQNRTAILKHLTEIFKRGAAHAK